jgi:hypothetical protein
MKTSNGLCLLFVLAILFASFGQVVPAYAGFTSVNVSGVGDAYPNYVWDISNEDWVGVDETWDSSTGNDYGITVWGTTDSDPILTITKNIFNGTGFAWQGYNIDLDPMDTDTFVGVPTSGGTSGGMTLLGSSTNYSLDWGVPNIVLPGQTVSFTFQVNVPDTGPFAFTLTQSPVLVPEPATITMVALAALALLGYKRKRA